ncbi:MAG: diguanylate cyclase [Bradymonadales bacterium]|nr:MAG: diguanylate cyclase [Bradymonadales bacterium]
MTEKPPKKSFSEVDEKTGDHTVVSPIETLNPIEGGQTPSLLMISGPQIGRSFPIHQSEFMIGRSSQSDLPIEDDLVSRYHCKLVVTAGGAELIDLGSTNGTLLNGRKVDKAQIQEGDQIQVGSTTIFKFHFQEAVETKFMGSLFDAATKDFLTGTYNKKFFLERLQDEFHFAHRNQKDLSILVLDLDHFKTVNDTHGHLAGDIALKKVAHHILSHTRKDDVVARFGGEEFVILARDLSIEKASNLGEHLRKGVEALAVEDSGKKLKLTVSVGVASLLSSSKIRFESFQELLDAADQKLYEAKKAGRNRVCN